MERIREATERDIELFEVAKDYLANEDFDVNMDNIEYFAIDSINRVVEFHTAEKTVNEDEMISSNETLYRVSLKEKEVTIMVTSTDIDENKVSGFDNEDFGTSRIYTDRNTRMAFRITNDNVLVKSCSYKEQAFNANFDVINEYNNTYTNMYKFEDDLNLAKRYPKKQLNKQFSIK